MEKKSPKDLAAENAEREKHAAALALANGELLFQIREKEKVSSELAAAKKELAFQSHEREKRAAELALANKELIFQNKEKEKRAAELIIANRELKFQNLQKEQRAAELAVANTELNFQNVEKEKRASELIIANTELAFQNNEKRQRAAELAIANIELTFQNDEKGKRSAELTIANAELAFQNTEKEKRAEELAIANKELLYQNQEKENRAAELLIANDELALQNIEKERRATELLLANIELAYQNEEKAKRAAELVLMNKELESFTFISSHDLQEPLRKIQVFASRILTDDFENLSENGKNFFERMQVSALHMQNLINDLLAYSRSTAIEGKFENRDLATIVQEVQLEFVDELKEKNAVIKIGKLGTADVIPFQFRQLLHNLVSNSLKFVASGIEPKIIIESESVKFDKPNILKLTPGKEYCKISFRDNGIGFDRNHHEKIFEIFQRLHGKDEYSGTGMGLTIVKKIVDNHKGLITADGEIGKGAVFNIYIPKIF